MKKRLLLMGILLILLTGCTPIQASNNDYKGLINNILKYNNNSVNNASIGYQYYLPKGISIIENKDYNQRLRYLNNYMYLYVDIVSYYHKNNVNLKDNTTNHYYYSNIDNKGYILIDQESNKYFVKIIYNYAKIEFYSDKLNLNKMISYGTIILNSIKYNDLTIESILNNNSAYSSELEYKVKGPNHNVNFTLEEYIDEEEAKEELPDE